MEKALNAYIGITTRNMKVFFKNKLAIILSMLTQIIILFLYILFLKNNYIDAIQASIGELKSLVTDRDIDALVNSWLVSGVIGTSVVTAALNALSVMVSDKQEKIDFDYKASSVKDGVIVMSYFSGAVLSTLITSSVLLTAGLVFLYVTGPFSCTATDIIILYGLVILGAVSASIILMTIVSFFKKSSTLSSFGIMVSAGIGFVVGAYIPVSQFGENTQTAVNLVPGSQITGMIRNILVKPAIKNISDALGGLDNGLFKRNATDMFALKLNIFGNSVDMKFMLIYSLIAIALFLVLNIILYRFSSKRKV